MALIAVLGDTHFGVRGDSSIFLEYQEKFYRQVFFPTIDARGVSDIIHVGDVFDRRKFINFATLSAARQMFFDPLRQRPHLHTHITLGNHDAFFRETFDITALEELLQNDRAFTLYTHPTEVLIGGRTVLMLPWICDVNRARSVELIQESAAGLVCGHLECAGFESDRGRIQEQGMDAAALQRFALVLTGHYHHASRMGSVQYLGAPYEMTWADYQSPKGFWLLDTETLALERILNPYRMFYRLSYDDSGADGSYAQKYVATIKAQAAVLKQSYVKLSVKAKQQPHWFDLVLDALTKVEPLDIVVVEDALLTPSETDDVAVPVSLNTASLIDAYLQQAVLRDADHAVIRTLMLTLFQEAVDLTNAVDAS